MCRIGGRLRSRDASSCGVDVEIPHFGYLGSNLLKGQRLGGSLTGVVASKSVTEASKGALGPIGNRPYRVQGHKGAGLGGRHAEQGRKSGLVIRRIRMAGPSIKG